ncbi:MAG: hypothetical protein ACFFD2_00730 [Promethearchaeota archaeon]
MTKGINENLIYNYKGKDIFESTTNIKEYLYKLIAEEKLNTYSELGILIKIPNIINCNIIIKLFLDKSICKIYSSLIREDSEEYFR